MKRSRSLQLECLEDRVALSSTKVIVPVVTAAMTVNAAAMVRAVPTQTVAIPQQQAQTQSTMASATLQLQAALGTGLSGGGGGGGGSGGGLSSGGTGGVVGP